MTFKSATGELPKRLCPTYIYYQGHQTKKTILKRGEIITETSEPYCRAQNGTDLVCAQNGTDLVCALRIF